MPLFYFDTDDGRCLTKDEYGIELPNTREALSVAVDSLPDLAQGLLLPQNDHTVGVRVRGAGGGLVVEVSLDVVVKWGPDSAP